MHMLGYIQYAILDLVLKVGSMTVLFAAYLIT